MKNTDEQASAVELPYFSTGIPALDATLKNLAAGDNVVWQVDDIEPVVDYLAKAGVEMMKYSLLDQAPSGVWTTPDGNKVAWFKDPDGNLLSVSQHNS